MDAQWQRRPHLPAVTVERPCRDAAADCGRALGHAAQAVASAVHPAGRSPAIVGDLDEQFVPGLRRDPNACL